MNSTVQHSLVILALVFAVWFLLKKFGMFPKQNKSNDKSCGQDDCGCS